MTREVVRAFAGVARSLEAALESLVTVGRNVRVLADALEGDAAEGGSATTTRRGPASPRPTVEFSEIDAKKAERALARAGVRRTT